MNGWSTKSQNLVKRGLAPVAGVVTASAISEPFTITAGGALHCVLACKVSGVTQVGTLTISLQTGIEETFVTVKASAGITADGWVFVRMNNAVSADQASLPLLTTGRAVLTTTDADDEITVEKVYLIQEL